MNEMTEKLEQTPEWMTKVEAAQVVTERFFKIAPITVGRWPISKKYIGGKALLNRDEVLARARLILAAAPSDFAFDEIVRGKGVAANKAKSKSKVSQSTTAPVE